MQKYLLALVAVLHLCACSTFAAAKESPRVIATVKPIHSLVAAVMRGSGEPRLLIPSGASPHTYQLKPSDARALQDADIIFWVGEDLERFLEKSLTSLPKNARVTKLAAAPGVTLRNPRESGMLEVRIDAKRGYVANDGSAPEHYGIEHRGADMHIWLDVDNARAIVRAAADALVSADPERAELYRDNRERAEARLVNLDQALRSELTPVAGRPYIVFHDAYRYLERRYGLTPVGAIISYPERLLSAQQVAAIRKTLVDTNAICIFSEPQFEPALVNTVIEGTEIRVGVLDADGGIGVTPGPDAYFTLMRNLGVALKTCLDQAS